MSINQIIINRPLALWPLYVAIHHFTNLYNFCWGNLLPAFAALLVSCCARKLSNLLGLLFLENVLRWNFSLLIAIEPLGSLFLSEIYLIWRFTCTSWEGLSCLRARCWEWLGSNQGSYCENRLSVIFFMTVEGSWSFSMLWLSWSSLFIYYYMVLHSLQVTH